MKRLIYGLPLAAVLLFSGCEKEQPTPAAAGATSQKPKPNVESNEKSAISITSITPLSACGGRVCNAEDNTQPFKYNMIEVTINHSPTGTVNYALYEVTPWVPGLEVGSRIAQFQCSLSTTRYANDLLNNGAKLMVYAMHPGDTAPSAVIISGGNVLFSPTQITDSDYDFVTLGNHEGAAGCGDPNG